MLFYALAIDGQRVDFNHQFFLCNARATRDMDAFVIRNGGLECAAAQSTWTPLGMTCTSCGIPLVASASETLF